MCASAAVGSGVSAFGAGTNDRRNEKRENGIPKVMKKRTSERRKTGQAAVGESETGGEMCAAAPSKVCQRSGLESRSRDVRGRRQDS